MRYRYHSTAKKSKFWWNLDIKFSHTIRWFCLLTIIMVEQSVWIIAQLFLSFCFAFERIAFFHNSQSLQWDSDPFTKTRGILHSYHILDSTLTILTFAVCGWGALLTYMFSQKTHWQKTSVASDQSRKNWLLFVSNIPSHSQTILTWKYQCTDFFIGKSGG